ncbi:response regulator [Xanthobacter wiegelii]|uniref:response regulator n=1 Tax=Xanthobacter wiegelii TaxID=3119913 RepID=UPI0037288B3A
MSSSLLIVEDDSEEARRLEQALTRMGYRCTVAQDGDTALALLAAERFDAVLLDLVLPGLDGMGVLSALTAAGDETPVVVQVTSAGLDAAGGAIRAGARDFVVKPAGALRLEVALTNAIALGRASGGSRPVVRQAGAVATPDNVIAFPSHAAQARAAGAADAAIGATFAHLDASGHARRLDQIEAEAIRFACHLYGGRMAEVARRLGIGRSTLYRKLAELDGTEVEPNHQLEPSAAQFVAAE